MHVRIVQNRKSSYADTVRIVSPRGNVSYDVQIIKIGPLMQAGCSHKNKVKRKNQLRNQNVRSHVFTQTTHVVAVSHRFACVAMLTI